MPDSEPDADALADIMPMAGFETAPPPVIAAPGQLEAAPLPAKAAPPAAMAAPAAPAQALPVGLEALGLQAAAPGLVAAAVQATLPTAASPAPAPARQVAPVAIALGFCTDPRAGFILALEPAELGRVEIRLQREGEGQSLRITAERPETLALLVRDRAELDRGLAQAGLRLEGGGLTFALAGDAPPGHDPGQQRNQRGSGQNRRADAPGTDAPPPPILLRRSLLDLNI